MQRLLAWLACLVAVSAAAANPKAAALAKEADGLYRENNDYAGAAKKLEEAWALEATPVYAYNIARAWDQAGELDKSVEWYRRYVALPSDTTSPDLVRKANLAMDRLRTLLARREADKKLSEAELKRLADEARKAEERADAEAEAARVQRREFEQKEQARRQAEAKTVSTRKVAAFATGGVAVVGYGLAIGFGIAANGNRDAFRTAPTLAGKQQAEAATRTTALVTDVSLLVALAATAATVILFPKQVTQEGGITIGFAPLAQGGGLASLEVRF